MDISEFETDLDLEKNGVWVDIGGGAQLLVARIGNPQFQTLLRKKTKPVLRLINQNRLPDEALEEMMIETMAETVLLDWKGLTRNGENVPFSKANALKLLKKRDFRTLVQEIANTQETFRAEAIEEDAGNSEAS
jgi:hypothetical protein